MPRKTHATHPDHVRTTTQPATTATQISQPAPPAPIPETILETQYLHEFYTQLQSILSHNDGWLRVVPDGDGKTVWYKWKWTSGRWSNHYVMVRGEQGQLLAAVSVLARKQLEVNAGYSKPTQDRYFGE